MTLAVMPSVVQLMRQNMICNVVCIVIQGMIR